MNEPRAYSCLKYFMSKNLYIQELIGRSIKPSSQTLENLPQNRNSFVVILQFSSVSFPVQILIKIPRLEELALILCVIRACALCGTEGKLTFRASKGNHVKVGQGRLDQAETKENFFL